MHNFFILMQVMETKNMLYLVTEYAKNGEIFGKWYQTFTMVRCKFWYLIWNILLSDSQTYHLSISLYIYPDSTSLTWRKCVFRLTSWFQMIVPKVRLKLVQPRQTQSVWITIIVTSNKCVGNDDHILTAQLSVSLLLWSSVLSDTQAQS